jgi:hypothetical protein
VLIGNLIYLIFIAYVWITRKEIRNLDGRSLEADAKR